MKTRTRSPRSARDYLRDALRNLLENAIRHAPGSAISVTIETDGDEIVVWVRDAGPGMDAFTAAHAFDRFFRGPDLGEVSGTGLGLAIIRRIIDRAGGRVRLESAPGTGTAVEVRLPRADPVLMSEGGRVRTQATSRRHGHRECRPGSQAPLEIINNGAARLRARRDAATERVIGEE